jgi:hypothetical protein
MLPRNIREELLSRAYVRAIAAQAGVICSEPEQDFGIDLCLRAVRGRGQRIADVSGQFDVQVKSTTRASVTENEVRYDLEVKNYDDLREPGDNCPRILVVVVLSEEQAQWLSQSVEELILRHCAYWISLEGYPATTATTTVRIAILRSAVFSVEAIRTILVGLRERTNP